MAPQVHTDNNRQDNISLLNVLSMMNILSIINKSEQGSPAADGLGNIFNLAILKCAG